MRKTSGVYKITNIFNGNFYIGSSISIEYRLKKHKSFLKLGKHPNKHLQFAWDKYGEAFFKFEILFTCPPEYMIKLEQWSIDNLKPTYNLRKKVHDVNRTAKPEETKQKLSIINKGKTIPVEVRLKISESCKKSCKSKGVPRTEEVKKKLREIAIVKTKEPGYVNPFKGKHHTQELKDKMKEFHTGNTWATGTIHSDEVKQHMSEAAKKRVRIYTEEQRQKDIERMKGNTYRKDFLNKN